MMRGHLRREEETLRGDGGVVSVVEAVHRQDHPRRHQRPIPPRHRPKEGGEAGDLVGGVPTMILPGSDGTEEIRHTVPGVGTSLMEAIDRGGDRGEWLPRPRLRK